MRSLPIEAAALRTAPHRPWHAAHAFGQQWLRLDRIEFLQRRVAQQAAREQLEEWLRRETPPEKQLSRSTKCRFVAYYWSSFG